MEDDLGYEDKLQASQKEVFGASYFGFARMSGSYFKISVSRK